MSNKTFEVECVDCRHEFTVTSSPAHLICQKCGSGQIQFPHAVIFRCHMGHEQRGRIADERCKKCYSFQQKGLRHFERLQAEEEEKKSQYVSVVSKEPAPEPEEIEVAEEAPKSKPKRKRPAPTAIRTRKTKTK